MQRCLLAMVSGLVILASACRKHPDQTSNASPNVTVRPGLYDLHTKPYINPYMGTIRTGSAIPPSFIYPDKYYYWSPCANPNNDYEFCYCRVDPKVQTITNMDLFVYNFCTGESKLVANSVRTQPDWSKKDWILYTTTDGGIWKVKSNGDSLTQLVVQGTTLFPVKWSPTGIYFIYNFTNVADEDGNTRYVIDDCKTVFGWFDDNTIINRIENTMNKVDVPTNTMTMLFTIPQRKI